MKITVRELTYSALLIALNIILTRLFSLKIPFEGIEGIRIGFGHLPLILAGLLLGPVRGFTVGVLGDMIGFQLSPSGYYLPTFTLVAGLSSLLPVVILRWIGGVVTLRNMLIAVAVSQSITSLVLTPYLLQLHFGIPIWATLPGRIVSQALMIPCFAVLTQVILTRLMQSGAGLRCHGLGIR